MLKTAINPLDHQRLVWSIALRCRFRGLELEDLVGYGQVGLLEACARFDPGRDIRFSTYASYWIRAAIWYAIENYGSAIRVPCCWHRLIHKKVRTDAPHLTRKQRECLAAARHVLEHGPDPHASFDETPDDRPAADDLEELEELAALPLLLGHLTSLQREVLRLRHGFDGPAQGTRKISAAVGCPQRRVVQIEAEALERLRALIGYDED